MNHALVAFGQKPVKEWKAPQNVVYIRHGGTFCATSRAVKQKTPKPGASGSCKAVQTGGSL